MSERKLFFPEFTENTILSLKKTEEGWVINAPWFLYENSTGVWGLFGKGESNTAACVEVGQSENVITEIMRDVSYLLISYLGKNKEIETKPKLIDRINWEKGAKQRFSEKTPVNIVDDGRNTYRSRSKYYLVSQDYKELVYKEIVPQKELTGYTEFVKENRNQLEEELEKEVEKKNKKGLLEAQKGVSRIELEQAIELTWEREFLETLYAASKKSIYWCPGRGNTIQWLMVRWISKNFTHKRGE